MTPTDDEICAAATGFRFDDHRDYGATAVCTVADVIALYRAAYAAGRLAGMDEAALVCERFQGERGERYAEIVRTRDEPQRAAMALDMAYAAMRCADAIRAAKDAT